MRDFKNIALVADTPLIVPDDITGDDRGITGFEYVSAYFDATSLKCEFDYGAGFNEEDTFTVGQKAYLAPNLKRIRLTSIGAPATAGVTFYNPIAGL